MRTNRITVVALAAGLAVSGMASVASAQLVETINFSNFNSVAGLQLNGSTFQSAGLAGEQQTLSLTPPATRRIAGSVFHQTTQSVNLGFSTTFQFRMRDRMGTGADGMAFVIQGQGATALGAQGGGVGFADNPVFDPTGGITNGLAIAFDPWENTEWSSPAGANTVYIQSSGPTGRLSPTTAQTLGSGVVSGAINDGTIKNVSIVYTPGLIQVTLDSVLIAQANVNLDTAMALSSGRAFVGFTGSTGGLVNGQRHELLNWQFSSVIPAPASAALLGLGGFVAARRRRSC